MKEKCFHGKEIFLAIVSLSTRFMKMPRVFSPGFLDLSGRNIAMGFAIIYDSDILFVIFVVRFKVGDEEKSSLFNEVK